MNYPPNTPKALRPVIDSIRSWTDDHTQDAVYALRAIAPVVDRVAEAIPYAPAQEVLEDLADILEQKNNSWDTDE